MNRWPRSTVAEATAEALGALAAYGEYGGARLVDTTFYPCPVCTCVRYVAVPLDQTAPPEKPEEGPPSPFSDPEPDPASGSWWACEDCVELAVHGALEAHRDALVNQWVPKTAVHAPYNLSPVDVAGQPRLSALAVNRVLGDLLNSLEPVFEAGGKEAPEYLIYLRIASDMYSLPQPLLE